MTENQRHHRRKSIRLSEFDYSSPGAYFLTMCTIHREMVFEQFPELEDIVRTQWHEIPNRFLQVELDAFIIMPNHIHGIVFLRENPVGATLAVAQESYSLRNGTKAAASAAPTISSIVGAFKSLCVHHWLKHVRANGIPAVGAFWQKNYYEHVIRTEEELNRCREYVINNPQTWQLDRENPSATGTDSFELSSIEEVLDKCPQYGVICCAKQNKPGQPQGLPLQLFLAVM